MKIERVSSLKNIERLAKIIFINFISLENQPDIQFSIEDIKSTLSSNSLIGWLLLDDDSRIDIIGTINILETKTKFNVTVHRDIFDQILTLGCQHFFGENHEMKLKQGWFSANNYDVVLRIFNIDEQEND